MSWDLERIKESRKLHIEQKYGHLSKEDLLEALLDLETAIYPISYVLRGLTQKAPRGIWALSKLFPSQDNDDNVLVFKDGLWTEIRYHSLNESKLHEAEYPLEESIDIKDGTRLHDDFMILEVIQEYFGATANCGKITMGDIRRLNKILFAPLIEDE